MSGVNLFTDFWHNRYTTASLRQGMPAGRAVADKCQTKPRCLASDFGVQDGKAMVLAMRKHCHQTSPSDIHFAQSDVSMAGSRVPILQA